MFRATNRPGDLHWLKSYRNRRDYARGTEAAVRKAAAFQQLSLKNPSLLMVIPTCSLASHTLFFSKRFADSYCSWPDKDIVLDGGNGKKWVVAWRAAVLPDSSTPPRLSTGFMSFVGDNGIKAGDVCVFEVQTFGFMVHLFKAEAEEHTELRLFVKPEQQLVYASDSDSGDFPGAPVAKLPDQLQKPKAEIPIQERKPAEDQEQGKEPQEAAAGPKFAPEARKRSSEAPTAAAAVCDPEFNLAEPIKFDDDFRFQIVFKKDASGMLRPCMRMDMLLEERQMKRLKGPFASTKQLLEALID